MRKVLLSILTIVILIASFFGVKIIVDSKTGPKTEVKKHIKMVTTAAVMNTSISIVIAANGSLQAKNVAANKGNLERSQERFKLGQVSSIELRQAQVNLFNAEMLKNLAKYDAKRAEYQRLQFSGQILNTLL
jgi:ABC-type Na+ efflux pump permease subunit